MQILTSIHETSPAEVAVMLGNFDGFHRAHARLCEQTCAVAKQRSLTPAAFCLRGMNPRKMPLFDEQEKLRALARAGIQILFLYDFSEISPLSAERFVEDVLLSVMRARAVLVGYDYRFGKGRCADCETLSALLGARAELSVLPAVCDSEGRPISSSRIRTLLLAGERSRAEELLGHEIPDSVMRQL